MLARVPDEPDARVRSFLARSESASEGSADGELASALESAFSEARAAWPSLEVADEEFVAYLGERVAPADLPSVRVPDLYLACACVAGVTGAADAFEAEIMPAVPKAVARIDSDPAFVDDITARVRVKLLMGDPPRVASYLGRGPLRSFAQVVGLREAQSSKRKVVMEQPYDRESLLDVPLGDDDPELAEVKRQLRGPFRRAFREALGELDARDRTVLRLYLVDGVGSETIGRMYGVHRATIARWISDARDAVFRGTKRRLGKELELSATSVASLMGKLATQLDITLSSFLDDAPHE